MIADTSFEADSRYRNNSYLQDCWESLKIYVYVIDVAYLLWELKHISIALNGIIS